MEYNLRATNSTINDVHSKFLEFKQWLGPDGQIWRLGKHEMTQNLATWHYYLPEGVIIIEAQRGFGGVKLKIKDFAKGKAEIFVNELVWFGFENVTPQTGQSQAAKKRKRNANLATLNSVKDAMEDWLTRSMSITAAAENNGTSPARIRKYIRQVLEMVDIKTRDEWIKLLKAMGELENHS